MGFSRPTLATLISRIETDLGSRLLDGATPLRRSVISVLARVSAGQHHMLYGYLEWLAAQPFVDTAEDEYLERHARIWGISRKAATAATGYVSIEASSGAVLPAGTEFTRDDGAIFTVDEECSAVLDSDVYTITASVTASVAGDDGNTDVGTTLSLSSPVSGVQTEGLVVEFNGSGLTGGYDTENDDDLRSRLLTRIQDPPHGGSAADYVTWALEVNGVTRAWCYPLYSGLGTVGVAIVSDDVDTGPLPTETLIDTVQEYIESVRPVTAEVTVFAPTAKTVNIELILSPNTTTVCAAVTAELQDLFLRESEPGATLYLSHIREAISIAQGEVDHVLLSPTTDIVPSSYEMPTLGTITFTTAV